MSLRFSALLMMCPSRRPYFIQPVSRTYRVAIFLKNCNICINQSSTTAQYFECDPPGLSEYLPWA
jgi:hypothetical protein